MKKKRRRVDILAAVFSPFYILFFEVCDLNHTIDLDVCEKDVYRLKVLRVCEITFYLFLSNVVGEIALIADIMTCK